ncbi:MAG: M48 family metallopeptidase [Candidatus Campbellbacteria bacterium]|nr:M48 family metallopeptidase [Candidatus Campbellbacteria bacterium]
MASLYTHRDSNKRKTFFLMSFFFVLVIAFAWGIGWYLEASWILYLAVIFAIGVNFFAYWNSHKIALALTGAKEITRKEYFDLWNAVENLSITAGLPMPKVYIIKDRSPNAFATGRDPEHGVIVVTEGLLEILNKTELEGVIAHELSHIGNRDILVSTVTVILAGIIAIVADIALRLMIYGGKGNSKGNTVIFVIAIAGAILIPIAATMIRMSVSRKREYLADTTGALLTRYPKGLADALEKIKNNSRRMEKANHATAHLFINDPFSEPPKQKLHPERSFFMKLFATHPPIDERIKILRNKAPRE